MYTVNGYTYFCTTMKGDIIYTFLENGFNACSIDHVLESDKFECTGYWNFSKYSFDTFIFTEEEGVTIAFRLASGDEEEYEQAILYLAYMLNVEPNPPRIYIAEHIDNEATRTWDKESMANVMSILERKTHVGRALQTLGMCISNPQKKYIFLDYGAKLIPALFELDANPVCMMIFAEFIKIKGSNMDLIHTLLPKIKLNDKYKDPHYTREMLGVILAFCQKGTFFKISFLSMRGQIALETRNRDKVASGYAINILSLLDTINPSTKPNNEEYHVLERELSSTK
jgi:hypothetical protein